MANTKTYNTIKAILDFVESRYFYTKEMALEDCKPNTIIIADANTPIGTSISGSKTIKVPAGSTETGGTVVTLPKGTWLFTAQGWFKEVDSGTYAEKHNAFQILVDGTKYDGSRQAFSGNYRVDMGGTIIQKFSESKTVGVSLRSYDRARSVTVHWKAVRLS